MAGESTESQKIEANQGLPDALAKMVDSLTKVIKELPQWAQFGAFFLVIALVATTITTLSLKADNYKFYLISAFLTGFSLFVLILYAFTAHQNKLEKETAKVRKAEGNLQEAVHKRINQLENIRNKLNDIKIKSEHIPNCSETNLLKEKISTLLEEISSDLNSVDEYQKNLIVAGSIEDRLKNSDIYERIAKSSSGEA
jgi:hypothetical protein